MDLRHLRYFVAVAEAQNVSRAADRLHLSQPSLSRQVHDLERELAVALFERTGRNLRLTGAGEDLLVHARRVLDQAGAFRERARAISGGAAGVLRVGAPTQSLQRFFPRMIQRFRRTMPMVDVHLTEGNSSSLIQMLRDGDLHLAFTTYAPEFGASCRPGGTVRLFVVVEGKRHRGDAIEISALEDVPLLLLQRGYGTRDVFDATCRVARIRTNVFLESNASATLLALAKAGCGWAILSGTVVIPREGFRVRVLTHDGKPVEVQTAIHWNPRRFLPAYAERFAKDFSELASRELGMRQG
jgi:DNA-binding transcriptional LysR family regulator